MQIDWTIVSVVLSFATAWTAVTLYAVKYMLDGTRKHIDASLTHLKTGLSEQDKHVQKVNQDLMELRATLPEKFVLREDWIRFNGVIDARLETVNEKLNRLLERGVKQRE